MPIDRTFQRTWKKSGSYQGITIWRSASGELEIYGTRVAIAIDDCTSCMKCLAACPVDVFAKWTTPSGHLKVIPIKEQECLECLACELVCPVDVILVTRSPSSGETLNALLE